MLLLTAIFSSIGLAEIYDLGGMYTYHYRDGRYADWGDFERHGARIAIELKSTHPAFWVTTAFA